MPLLCMIVGARAHNSTLILVGMGLAAAIILVRVLNFLTERAAAEWWRVVLLFGVFFAPFLILDFLIDVFVF